MHTVEVSHLAKRFGETQAVADVSFAIEAGRDLWPARPQRRRQDDDHPHDAGHLQAGRRHHPGLRRRAGHGQKAAHRLHARGARPVQGSEAGADPRLPGDAQGARRRRSPAATRRLAGAVRPGRASPEKGARTEQGHAAKGADHRHAAARARPDRHRRALLRAGPGEHPPGQADPRRAARRRAARS